MRKIVSIAIVIVITISSALSVHATQDSLITSYQYYDIGVEVIFGDNSEFSSAQQQRIAEILATGTPPVQSRAWCWLTGHDYVTDAVTVIRHEARTLNPRCAQEIYKVTTCNNCNYYEEELLSSSYIVCCPEE